MNEPIDFFIDKDKTCPRCGAKSFRVTLGINNGEIVIAPQLAPTLTRNHWRCPHCAKDFCANCFTPDYEGGDETIFCPHCNRRLQFPATLRYAPETLN